MLLCIGFFCLPASNALIVSKFLYILKLFNPKVQTLCSGKFEAGAVTSRRKERERKAAFSRPYRSRGPSPEPTAGDPGGGGRGEGSLLNKGTGRG